MLFIIPAAFLLIALALAARAEPTERLAKKHLEDFNNRQMYGSLEQGRKLELRMMHTRQIAAWSFIAAVISLIVAVVRIWA